MPFIELTRMVGGQLRHPQIQIDIEPRILIVLSYCVYHPLAYPRMPLRIQPVELAISMRTTEIGHLTRIGLEALMQVYNSLALRWHKQFGKHPIVTEIIPLHFRQIFQIREFLLPYSRENGNLVVIFIRASRASSSGAFGTRRQRRVLRQIVGDLEPGGFARYEEVAFGAYTWVIIKTAKSNSEFRGAIRAVYNW